MLCKPALVILGAVAANAQAPCESYIVVGAGMAGLGAVEKLIANGAHAANITVFEARPRTGGRVHTDSSSLGSDVKADLGASWIHGGGLLNPIRTLADMYWVATAEEDDVVAVRFHSDGSMYSSSQVSTARDEAAREVDSATEGSWTPLRSSLASNFWADGANGQLYRARNEFDSAGPDSQISAYRLLNSGADIAGPELIFRDGYSQIPNTLTQRLRDAGVSFNLGSEVTAVSYNSTGSCTGASVTTGGAGTHSASAVIVTVPLGVLQAGTIQFTPALPSSYQGVIDRLQMGNCGKAFARFDTDFWSGTVGPDTFVFAVDIPGASDSTRGGHFQFFNLQKYLGPGVPVLFSFMSGEYVQAADGKTDAEVQADFMRSLRIAFPLAPEPLHFLRTTWGSDPYSRGSYSMWAGVRYNANDYVEAQAQPAPTLAFAGEHTHPLYFSSVHGAYLSGQRAADQLCGIASSALGTAGLARASRLVGLALAVSIALAAAW